MGKHKIYLIIFLLPFFCVSQTLSGRIIDKITQQPIETVAVYFDNTTIGTTTNENGEFSIAYNDAVQSTLVISYLGYEKVLISDYRSKSKITIELIEAESALDEVHLEYDDGLTRRQKLRLFRKEFLGTSKFAKSCKILNEEDLILRYNKKNQSLYVSAKAPILVSNKAFNYKITYDNLDFEVVYRYINFRDNSFVMHSVTYLGTAFFKPLTDSNTKKIEKNRALAYNGSIQHFMRSLFNRKLEEEGYLIFHDKFRVNEWKFFNVEDIENKNFKKVTLKEKVTILFEKSAQSEIQLKTPEFYVDIFGNYTPIIGVYFSGAMGNQRVGDTLPLNYGFTN